MHPVITIFCPFTREWAVEGWLENLSNVKHDPALTNLCFIIDGDQSLILNQLKRYAEKNNYRSFNAKMNENWQPNEVRLAIRRQRIADVKNQSKDLINLTDGEYVICFEDDTVFDRLESFDRLLDPLVKYPLVGFVEGVQMGRWGANMVGVWLLDDVLSPKRAETLLPPVVNNRPDDELDSSYQNITGGGWYGYATRRNLYLNCDYYTSTSQPWGPDVNYGIYVLQQGYYCLVDWSTIFGHKDYNKVLYPDNPNVRLAKIIYNKDEITGKWLRTDLEKDNF